MSMKRQKRPVGIYIYIWHSVNQRQKAWILFLLLLKARHVILGQVTSPFLSVSL